MKCPCCRRRVGRGKQGMNCPGCGYRFYLDPKRPDHGYATDNQLLAAIQWASDHGTYYFTRNQLYGAFYRLRVRKHRGKTILGTGFFIAFATVFALHAGGPAWLWVIAPLLVLGGIAVSQGGQSMPSFADVTAAAQHLATARADRETVRPDDKLLTEKLLQQPPPQWSEPDLYDYGVERLLIVERDLLVDLLVLNDFHAQQRTLVIAESGYPSYLLPLAQRVLRARADLPVFLLHDVEPAENRLMYQRLRTQKSTFPIEEQPVTDLGLSQREMKQWRWVEQASETGGWERAPVDLVPYRQLGLVLAAAMESGVPLADVAGTQSDPVAGYG